MKYLMILFILLMGCNSSPLKNEIDELISVLEKVDYYNNRWNLEYGFSENLNSDIKLDFIRLKLLPESYIMIEKHNGLFFDDYQLNRNTLGIIRCSFSQELRIKKIFKRIEKEINEKQKQRKKNHVKFIEEEIRKSIKDIDECLKRENK